VAFFQDWSDQQIGDNRLQHRYNDNSFSKVYVVEDFHKHHQIAITIVKIPLTVSVIIPFSSSTITSAGVPTSNVLVMPTTVFRSAQHKRVLNKYMLFPFILGLLVAFSGCGLFPFGSSVQRCDLTISLSSSVTHMLSAVRLSSLPGNPHKTRSVLVLTHICACSAFFEP